MIDKKYLLFAPYRSGLSNVVMSYELGFALADAMNRTLVLAPSTFLYPVTGIDKSQWMSVWNIFDKGVAKSYFDLEDYYSLDEIKSFKPSNYWYQTWFGGIEEHIKDLYMFPEFPGPENRPIYSDRPRPSISNSNFCLVNDPSRFNNDEDFTRFVAGRQIIDINRPEKFVYIDDSLFQYFWYWIYPGGPKLRNLLKFKINKALRYKNHFYERVRSVIPSKLDRFNAVHIRRGDFFRQFSKELTVVDQSEKILERLLNIFDTRVPLYIASDEKNRSFFNAVKEKYQVYFIEDLFDKLGPLEHTIIDAIICSKALQFIGTYPSTYSKRINLMRGVDGIPTDDHRFINLDNYNSTAPDLNQPLPWTTQPSRRIEWNSSIQAQWTYEHVPKC